MRSRATIILVILCCIGVVGTTNPSPHSMGPAQVQSLKDDVNKMRALVQQMETNLSFVDTTQSPLKHQFQLEIDMWKLTIQRMDRELQGSR